MSALDWSRAQARRRGRETVCTDLCGGGLAGVALDAAAEVVDNDAGAAGAEEGGISLTEAAAGAGDDGDLAVVPQLSSQGVLLCCVGVL